MARIGDNYQLPARTDGVTDATIDSGKYNSVIHDIESDLNFVRPILYGGTGGNSPASARTALQTERSMQQVTNYSTHVFEAGSFYSVSGATDAPDGATSAKTFMGIATVQDVNNIIVRATQLDTGTVYTRRKQRSEEHTS